MAKRHKPDLTLPRLCSALTNGKFILAGTDHRSAWMRRLRDLVQAHISDLGGDDVISHSERMLINRASMLALQLERWSGSLPTPMASLVAMTSTCISVD